MADDHTTSIFDEGKREIFLITTSDDSRPSGMIITWVTSASLIPDDKRIVLVFIRRYFSHSTIDLMA